MLFMTGAYNKFCEDVNFGDVAGPVTKGPLSVRDELVWLMGASSPFLKAHKNEYDYKAQASQPYQHFGTSEKLNFYNAVLITLDAAMAYAKRHADLARKMA